MAIKVVGRFIYDSEEGTVRGPAEYMREQGNARIDQINAGGSVADRMILSHSPDPVTGVLVILQTDYAAWAGSRQMFGALKGAGR